MKSKDIALILSLYVHIDNHFEGEGSIRDSWENVSKTLRLIEAYVR